MFIFQVQCLPSESKLLLQVWYMQIFIILSVMFSIEGLTVQEAGVARLDEAEVVVVAIIVDVLEINAVFGLVSYLEVHSRSH